MDDLITTQFIGPSLTTESGGNPSFRVYEIDNDSNVVLDYKQYRLDMDKANKLGSHAKLEWDVAYSF